MAKRHNLDIDAGSDWSLEVLYQDPEEVAIDLTGGSAEMVIRKSIPGSPAALTLTSDVGGGLTITPEDGSILIQITRSQSAALSGRYVYDLHYTSAGDQRLRLLEGSANVSPLL
jgi:hypothetical protein